MTEDEMARYMEEADAAPEFTVEQEHDLVRRIRRGDQESRNALMTSNRRLVLAIARKYMTEDPELPDLVEAGNDGLARAADHYDPDRGFRFGTYAIWWIRQAITRFQADRSRGPRDE